MKNFERPNLPLANCVGADPRLFESDDPPTFSLEGILEAKDICRACKERLKCLEWALKHERWGIWGGLTAAERKEFKRK